jgi:hypothetical protein
MSWRPTALIACAAIGAALAVPAASSGSPTLVNSLAAGACQAEKSEIGKRAFKKRYGAKKPMRACVKRARAAARVAVGEATAECLWELGEYGSEEFYSEWATFSACVEDYAAWIMDGGGFEEEEEDEGDEEAEE